MTLQNSYIWKGLGFFINKICKTMQVYSLIKYIFLFNSFMYLIQIRRPELLFSKPSST